MYLEGYGSRKKSYWATVISLITHLVGTALIFAVVLGLGWLVSVFFAWLHGMHAFPDPLFRAFQKFEEVLLYIDILICLAVLIGGAARFCYDNLKDL